MKNGVCWNWKNKLKDDVKSHRRQNNFFFLSKWIHIPTNKITMMLKQKKNITKCNNISNTRNYTKIQNLNYLLKKLRLATVKRINIYHSTFNSMYGSNKSLKKRIWYILLKKRIYFIEALIMVLFSSKLKVWLSYNKRFTNASSLRFEISLTIFSKESKIVSQDCIKCWQCRKKWIFDSTNYRNIMDSNSLKSYV